MNRTRTIVGTLALAATLALVAAGCGSSGGSESSDSSSDATTTVASTGSGSDAPVALDGKVNDEGTKDISGDGMDATLEMELDDFYFSPTYVKAAPGASVEVELENEGEKPHTFTLDDGSVTKELAPGEKGTVTVKIPEDGSLRFSCDFHGDMGMQGAFYTGTDSGSGSGSSDEVTTTTGASKSGY